ncbi:MAG: tRNA dihydrouridine synthase DusB [Prevotella sp.]|nr:tRNA dihydrouridine synthase DusB [Prevotella sp.]
MKIAHIDLGERPVVLAPMEDVTDRSFRLICKEQGASATYSEFVSADALIRSIAATTRKLSIDPGERPTAIQIYGRDVASMVEAARLVEEAGPDFIDINFGCPVKKVAHKGAGAGMLRNIPLMLEITREVVKAVKLPVTVKTRLGWDCNNIIIADLAEQLQDCGIAALTVHGRTRSQMYTGEADWETIARVKENPRLTIPLIGNGDITSGEKAREAFDRYGVDGIMVGRASIGAPWIFNDINRALGRGGAEPSMLDKFRLLRRQILESVERIDEYRGILHIRRHLAASPLFKGIPNFRPTRIEMLRADTLDSLMGIIDRVENMLNENENLGL